MITDERRPSRALTLFSCALLAGALLLPGCPEEEKDENGKMRPGEPCLSCHGENGPAGHDLTVAGTVFKDASGSSAQGGAIIKLTDAAHNVFELRANSVGNFYTTEYVQYPASVEVSCGTVEASGVPMMAPTNSGDCNSCHTGSYGNAVYCPDSQ